MVIRPEEYNKLETPKYFKCGVVGGPGTGKTHFSATFPKFYSLLTEPDSHWVWTINKKLGNNCYGWDYFVPTSMGDTRNCWDRLKKAVLDAKELFKQGKIETLILDNLTYLGENLWNCLETDPIMSKRGVVDTQKMYGYLGKELFKFILYSCITFPGNLVVTMHEMMENEETQLKKPDKSSPVVPNVLGGFRNKVEGLFPVVLYLEKEERDGKYTYTANTNKCNKKNAKNRFNLAQKIQDISYQTLSDAINKGIKGE